MDLATRLRTVSISLRVTAVYPLERLRNQYGVRFKRLLRFGRDEEALITLIGTMYQLIRVKTLSRREAFLRRLIIGAGKCLGHHVLLQDQEIKLCPGRRL